MPTAELTSKAMANGERSYRSSSGLRRFGATSALTAAAVQESSDHLWAKELPAQTTRSLPSHRVVEPPTPALASKTKATHGVQETWQTTMTHDDVNFTTYQTCGVARQSGDDHR